MKIYTKTGDKGETGLYGGKRVLKCDCNIESIGNIDELNASLGVVISKTRDKEIVPELNRIQEDLFLIGAVLAGKKEAMGRLIKRVEEMEKKIDKRWEDLPKLSHFILPGGSLESSFIHLSRAICRRAERSVVALKRNELGSVVVYLNRLSDYLFCLARWANFKMRVKEKTWVGP